MLTATLSNSQLIAYIKLYDLILSDDDCSGRSNIERFRDACRQELSNRARESTRANNV